MTVLQTRVDGARVLLVRPPWNNWCVVVVDDRGIPGRPVYQADGPYTNVTAALSAGTDLARA